MFGFATFGRVYGMIICISGMTNFSQYGLDALSSKVFHSNPTPINIGLACSGFVIGVMLVVYVWTMERIIKERAKLEGTDDEHLRLITEEE